MEMETSAWVCGAEGLLILRPSVAAWPPGLWPGQTSTEAVPGRESYFFRDRRSPKDGRGRSRVAHAPVRLLNSPFRSGSGVRPGV